MARAPTADRHRSSSDAANARARQPQAVVGRSRPRASAWRPRWTGAARPSPARAGRGPRCAISSPPQRPSRPRRNPRWGPPWPWSARHWRR
eukprot:8777279-Pyramimonas_sp.AAC.1